MDALTKRIGHMVWVKFYDHTQDEVGIVSVSAWGRLAAVDAVSITVHGWETTDSDGNFITVENGLTSFNIVRGAIYRLHILGVTERLHWDEFGPYDAEVSDEG